MNFVEIIIELINEFIQTAHPAVIHFPIIGIMMAFTAGMSGLFIRIIDQRLFKKDKITSETHSMFLRYVDRFEFTSFILIILGILGYIIAAITGIASAGGIDSAINHEILEFKVRLTIFSLFLLIIPVVLKTYVGVVYKTNLFIQKSILPSILYLLPLLIAAPLTVVVAGAGGVYVYGHTILDLVGLGDLIPGR